MQGRLRFRMGDAIVLALVLLLAGLVWLFFWRAQYADEPLTVQIYQNGVLIKTLPLSENAVYTVFGLYENTVTVENGAVSVTHATCPGADCVHAGRIDRAGQSIICLPNRVEIRLSGETDVDIIVQ